MVAKLKAVAALGVRQTDSGVSHDMYHPSKFGCERVDIANAAKLSKILVDGATGPAAHWSQRAALVAVSGARREASDDRPPHGRESRPGNILANRGTSPKAGPTTIALYDPAEHRLLVTRFSQDWHVGRFQRVAK
jgi:hypothetical protein